MSNYSGAAPCKKEKSADIYLLPILVMLAALTSVLASCQQSAQAPTVGAPIEYATYIGPTDGPPFSYEGPKGWTMRARTSDEGDQCKYSSVTLYGPGRPRGSGSTTLEISATPPKEEGGCFDSLEQILREYRRLESEHLKIDEATHTVFNGSPALQIAISGESRDLNEGVPVGESYPSTNRITAIDGNGYIYEIHLAADPTEFEQYYAPVYYRAINTLKFGQK